MKCIHFLFLVLQKTKKFRANGASSLWARQCPHFTEQGADVGVMKFYCTEYSTGYGQEGFNPRIGRHSGTGYQSNFRPGVYYSRRLDELDNPALG